MIASIEQMGTQPVPTLLGQFGVFQGSDGGFEVTVDFEQLDPVMSAISEHHYIHSRLNKQPLENPASNLRPKQRSSIVQSALSYRLELQPTKRFDGGWFQRFGTLDLLTSCWLWQIVRKDRSPKGENLHHLYHPIMTSAFESRREVIDCHCLRFNRPKISQENHLSKTSNMGSEQKEDPLSEWWTDKFISNWRASFKTPNLGSIEASLMPIKDWKLVTHFSLRALFLSHFHFSHCIPRSGANQDI